MATLQLYSFINLEAAINRMAVYNKNITLDSLLASNTQPNKLQNELSATIRILRKTELINLLSLNDKTNKQLARFNSCMGLHNEASKWLEAIPKSVGLQMNNNQFIVAINSRLGLVQSVIPLGVRCSCKGKPIIDQFGHHLSTGCGTDGFRHKTHNEVCYEIQKFAKSVGYRTILEDNKLFKDFAYHSRPDLTICNGPCTNKNKLIIDTVVTNPTNGNININQASICGRAGKIAEMAKIKKYTKHNCIPSDDIDLLPIAFESFGTINEKGWLFLKALATQGEFNLGISSAILLQFWLARISVCLQKALAESILSRSFKFRSANISFLDRSLSKQVIRDSCFSRNGTFA
jgi:hypothetical protein